MANSVDPDEVFAKESVSVCMVERVKILFIFTKIVALNISYKKPICIKYQAVFQGKITGHLLNLSSA